MPAPTSTSTSPFVVDPVRAAALLVAVQRNRKGALDDLIHLCEPLVSLHARRYAWNRNDVDDIVQEVWLRLMLKADQIRNPRTLICWLHVVTRRTATQLGRRNGRAIPTEMSDSTPSSSSTEDDALGRHEREEITTGVRQALRRFNDHEQQLLVLLHQSDRPGYDEISRQVARPVGSLGPTRRRLLNRMRSDKHIERLALLPTG